MAKGLAIVLVVLGHCLDSATAARAFVYSFHMPLFFVLAGFTMRPKPRMQVLVTSFRRLIVPYLAVSAILLFFAFVPPSSISSSLDTQLPAPVVLGEIAFGSGQEGSFLGWSYEAIGALWFLPCLFVARLILNEVLLLGQRVPSRAHAQAQGKGFAVELACVTAVAIVVGFICGTLQRLPFDIDTACIAVGYMYVGYLAKKLDLSRLPVWALAVLVIVWLLYPFAGNNEMAIRAYLQHPWSLATSVAGSLVVMRACMVLERVPGLSGALAWCGVSSLSILCVHRVESAVLNWQKIMEFFCPGVWSWGLTAQGFYQFALRVALVLALTAIVRALARLVRRAWQRSKGARQAELSSSQEASGSQEVPEQPVTPGSSEPPASIA